ncbi:MAG TPA: GntR family transcriptional regulator [Thermoanaerobaculia bacterium]|nr:GntR family transcriptional regulator [Thermoanaerobaculia bacterium]
MLVLQIDLASTVPAYEQIASRLRALLVDEKVVAGQQLPTVRELALDLGVHHNTVAEAYRQLAAEGWVDLRRGRGATVLARRLPAPTRKAHARFTQALEELIARGVAEGLPRGGVAAELEQRALKLRNGARE